jgi:hypothetical protein
MLAHMMYLPRVFHAKFVADRWLINIQRVVHSPDSKCLSTVTRKRRAAETMNTTHNEHNELEMRLQTYINI